MKVGDKINYSVFHCGIRRGGWCDEVLIPPYNEVKSGVIKEALPYNTDVGIAHYLMDNGDVVGINQIIR